MRVLIFVLLSLALPAAAHLQCVDLFSLRAEPLSIAAHPVEVFRDDEIYRVTSGPFVFEGHLQNRILHVSALLALPQMNQRSQLRGEILYTQMIEHFKIENIDKIAGNWFAGTNYEQFFNNLKETDNFKHAARQTWSGVQAAKHGYSQVESVKIDIDMKTGEPTVIVLFSRP